MWACANLRRAAHASKRSHDGMFPAFHYWLIVHQMKREKSFSEITQLSIHRKAQQNIQKLQWWVTQNGVRQREADVNKKKEASKMICVIATTSSRQSSVTSHPDFWKGLQWMEEGGMWMEKELIYWKRKTTLNTEEERKRYSETPISQPLRKPRQKTNSDKQHNPKRISSRVKRIRQW